MEQTLSPAEIARVQLERLQSSLNRAYKNVPFHRNRLAEAGIEPSMVESLEDISKLPLTGRVHISDHYPYGLFSVPLRDIVRIHTAPGTGVNPAISGYTRQDLEIWEKMVAGSLASAGITPHDIVHIHFNAGLANWGRDYKDGAERIGAGVIPNTAISVEKKLMIIRDYKTSVLITTTSSVLQLADHLFKSGINPTELDLKTVILAGEYPKPETRRYIEESLHVKTWVHYGLTEIPGPAIGFECGCHDGIHINEENFLVEIIDPTTGAPQPDGTPGEIILTSLNARAYPLIRFRTGDRGAVIGRECSCGSGLVKLDWDGSRTDDLMNIGGVKIRKKQIGDHLKRGLGINNPFSFSVESRNFRDILEIRIAIDKNLFSDEIKELEKTLIRMQDKLQERLAVPIKIKLTEGGA